tara:strand:- start:123 stop:713 length:591 start_codon:yes stop_codon:yes gene_type:complete
MIIGICGLIGSGKGTVADILVEHHNFKKLSFADKLKDGVSAVFGWDRQMLEGDNDESRKWREEKDKFWSKETGKTITPRLILQLFGTDCMRNGYFDGIWVSLVKQKIIDYPDTNWVIPDVRFPNEVKMIQNVQGEVWQVRRGELPGWFIDKRDNNIDPLTVHASEWAWIDKDNSFDHIIYNDNSLEELLKKIKKIV